jgi:hypothetical protein
MTMAQRQAGGNKQRRILRAALVAACMASLGSPAVMAKGGSGGGGGSCDLTPVLPQVAPAPGVLLRESFGPANLLRPKGDKGCNDTTYTHTSINGFWVEWPGSRNSKWMAPPESTQTWRLCVVSGNPYEEASPLQQVNNGCMTSEWFDPVATRPTALVPFTQPAGLYEVHLDLWPGLGDPTYYLGFGMTDSAVLDRNLETSAGLWFELGQPDVPYGYVTYNVRTNGRSGPVLATGLTPWAPWMPADLRYDPVTQTASASLNGIELGTWPVANVRAPKFIGIEGVGNVDNLVVTQLN